MTTGTVTSADGTTIAFTRVGQGPPLVLVDGALCFRENGPSPDLARVLASTFTVFTYDRRGRGESGDTKPYAIAREVDDLAAVIRRCHPEVAQSNDRAETRESHRSMDAGDSVFVFGSSSGAALALHAVAAGLPIEKLVLYEPPIGAVRPGGPPFDEARNEIDALVATGDTAAAARYFLTEMLGTPRFFVALMRILMRSTWTRVKSVAHTLPYDLALLADRSLLTARVSDLAVPTLVIAGAKSPPFMQQAATRIAHVLPNATTLLLPGESHDVSKAAPALGTSLTEFLLSS